MWAKKVIFSVRTWWQENRKAKSLLNLTSTQNSIDLTNRVEDSQHKLQLLLLLGLLLNMVQAIHNPRWEHKDDRVQVDDYFQSIGCLDDVCNGYPTFVYCWFAGTCLALCDVLSCWVWALRRRLFQLAHVTQGSTSEKILILINSGILMFERLTSL